MEFGNIDEDGFKILIDIDNITNEDPLLNSIIISMGKNNKGVSIFTETREQTIFDSFLKLTNEFENWVMVQIEKLENIF